MHRGDDEDLTWSDPYANVRDIVPGTATGKEQEAYVKYIVDNYDELANRTVFMHGRCPSCGFGHDSLTVSIVLARNRLDPRHMPALPVRRHSPHTPCCRRGGTGGIC